MQDGAQAEPPGNFYEQIAVIHVNHFFFGDLGGIQRQVKDVRIGLAKVDEAGGDVEVDEGGQAKLLDAVFCQLAPLVADTGDFETVPLLELLISSIISGNGFDWANMNSMNSSWLKSLF